jgi:hypothetical protein
LLHEIGEKFPFVDITYLEDLLSVEKFINVTASCIVVSSYLNALTETEKVLADAKTMLKKSSPQKHLMVYCVRLCTFFDFLYGAMREDADLFIYKDHEQQKTDIELMLRHLDYSNLGNEADYYKKVDEGSKSFNQLVGTVSRGFKHKSGIR